MKQQTIEKFDYSIKDIEELIYKDIRASGIEASRARVKIGFDICADPTDNDYQSAPRHILKGANVTVDVTK